ncbi:MAG: CoA transferase, partial [Pseudomonas sp.]
MNTQNHKIQALPLAGIRVVEFVHMVMGPTCGLVLADLGA